jgi:hypothetical protein
MLTLRNHASTYIWCDILPTRAGVPHKMLLWVEHIRNTFGRFPKQIRSDNAPKYVHTLKKLLQPTGVLLEPVVPYSPEQNGEAERVNRILGDMARTMLHESRMPRMFWGYAYQTAGYIYNRIPNSKVKTCPLQKLYGIEPDPNSLYPFGAEAIVQIPAERRTKLDEHAEHGRLTGYPEAGHGWLVYSSRERRIIHSTSVIFPEFQHLLVKKKKKKGDLDFILNQITLKLGEEETEVFARDKQQIISKLELKEDRRLPSNIKKVLASEDGKLWEEAANYKMKKFTELEVWEPVKPFPGVKALGCRWVFAIKPGTQGEPETFRARYVAKGFNQKMGVDCNKTYAPTASLNTLRLLISLANKKDYPTATFDVSSAYLYSPIEEEVYVQPPSKLFPELKGKIMKLKKAMYGTKQAARCWWQFFKSKMELAGLVALELEPSLYIYCRDQDFVIIWLHVDDGFALASDQRLLIELRQEMEKSMKIKWSDSLERLVGINFKKIGKTVELSQENLACQIVHNYQRPTL